jgi:hypothetical protein
MTGGQEKKGKSKPMKNQDTITTVITFLLVLPWLARTLASGKAIWRALADREKGKEIN